MKKKSTAIDDESELILFNETQIENKIKGYVKKEICECCGSSINIWKKPLIGIAICELIKLYNIYKIDNTPVHISKFSKQRSNFYTLAYWGLIKGSDKVDGKKTAGLWVPTDKAVKFIKNEITIPSYAVTKNNKLITLTGEEKTIIQSLGKKFNYDELIADSFNT